MPDSLQNFTNKFFTEKREFLETKYPGLTERRIKQELALLTSIQPVEELFNSLYINHPENPLTKFFQGLEQGMPLEYITGRAWFYRSEFEVNPSVLIPRSETETLVEKAILELKAWAGKTGETLKFCDVGTGSGVIPISILQEMNHPTMGVATDISKDAINVAKRNYFNLRYTISPKNELRFETGDRLAKIEDLFHVIVSNPPYIKRESDRELVHSQVLEFEPGIALWLDDKIYNEWFSDLFKASYNHLFDEGLFIMEGHENHLEELVRIGEKEGFRDIQLDSDLAGRTRFLKMRK